MRTFFAAAIGLVVLGIAAPAVAGVGSIGVRSPASPGSNAGLRAVSGNGLSVHRAFYSDYTKITASYSISDPGGCQSEENDPNGDVYGDPLCADWLSQDASVDLNVYKSYPGPWRRVLHRREEALGGSWEYDLFDYEIGIPYLCPYRGYYRNYKAVVTLEGGTYSRSISRHFFFYWMCR
jgi:hypothetical protein